MSNAFLKFLKNSVFEVCKKKPAYLNIDNQVIVSTSPDTKILGIENYITYNLSSSERSAMAQFRFGILPLNIETGRFRNQALEERLCTLCEFNEIEDESHFLFKCSLYDELRSE